MNGVWKVEAVGTDRGRSVIFLRHEDMREITVPTDVITMSKLAADGVRIRNIHTEQKRIRK